MFYKFCFCTQILLTTFLFNLSACGDDSSLSGPDGTSVDYRVAVIDSLEKTYKTITIGNQTWMAENLNYEFQDTSVFNVCYDNFESSCKMYGRLYDFNAAQKACPAGWHLPDTLEWCLLKRLADNGFGMMDYLENGYGFDALKGGNYLFENKKFVDKGYFVEFWTSSASDYYSGEDVRYNMSMEYGTDGARFRLVNMSNGAYVRCVKDGSQHPLPGAEIFVDKR